MHAVTETPDRVDRPAAPFRGWAHVAWWLCAWNAAVPIRLVGMYLDGARGRPGVGREIGVLILDQTSWAVATYVMFRLALRARRPRTSTARTFRVGCLGRTARHGERGTERRCDRGSSAA